MARAVSGTVAGSTLHRFGAPGHIALGPDASPDGSRPAFTGTLGTLGTLTDTTGLLLGESACSRSEFLDQVGN
jgi:hypothetical protein